MYEQPCISVVIPTHNRPVLLKRAIDSVLRQTLQSIEVVVVLDGHDPITEHLIAEFHEKRIRLVCLPVSVGGSEARNIGVRSARGQFIALLDDDDEWLPDKLEKQLQTARSIHEKNYVVVTKYVYRVEGRPDEIWPSHTPSKGEPLSEFLFSSRGGFQTSTYLCPRELLLRIPFTQGLKKHQDWDWFLQLTALPGFVLHIVPEPLSIYWIAARSRSSISRNQDWKTSRDWATRRLPWMTTRAYSQFIVKICTRSAVAQRVGPFTLASLFKDMAVTGSPTPMLFAEFAASLLVPEQLRLHLRYLLEPLLRVLRPTDHAALHPRIISMKSSQ